MEAQQSLPGIWQLPDGGPVGISRREKKPGGGNRKQWEFTSLGWSIWLVDCKGLGRGRRGRQIWVQKSIGWGWEGSLSKVQFSLAEGLRFKWVCIFFWSHSPPQWILFDWDSTDAVKAQTVHADCKYWGAGHLTNNDKSTGHFLGINDHLKGKESTVQGTTEGR